MKTLKSKDVMDIMRIKAGILVKGVFFTDNVLSILHNENRLVRGTGLFNYNEVGGSKIRLLGVAPGEIILLIHGIDVRIEVRSRLEMNNTPYKIYTDNGNFFLEDSRQKVVFPVKFPELCRYFDLKTDNDQLMINVARLMGASILRIYPDMRCDFAEIESGRCKFCNTFYGRPKIRDDQIISDILETMKRASSEVNLDGIFMSTGYFFNDQRNFFFAQLLLEIRKEFPGVNIVFSLAPQKKLENIKLLYEAGGSNLILSFNLEAYDKKLWIPGEISCFSEGKATVGRESYFLAYNHAVKIGGRGSVKSNFVLGLESLKSLGNGVKFLAEIGVSSSGTIFYPTPGAIWTNSGYDPRTKDFKNDPVNFVVEAYLLIAQAIIDYNLKIGWNAESRISGLEWDAFNYLTK